MERNEYLRKYRLKHRVEMRAYSKKYYLDHRNEKLTVSRKIYLKTRENRLLKAKKWREENREEYRKRTRNNENSRRKQMRKEILILLGNKCNNPFCPVPPSLMDSRALQIDHVNGGGTKAIRNMGYYSSLLKIKKEVQIGSKDYQILCVYCNWLKGLGEQKRAWFLFRKEKKKEGKI